MSTINAQSKIQAINDIKYQVIDKYLANIDSGSVNLKDISLTRFEKQVKNMKSADFTANDYIAYYSALAIIATAKGKMREAEALYSKAINLKPDDPSYLAEYNNVLVGACRFDEAQKLTEDHFESGGKNYSLLFGLSVCSLRNLEFTSFKKYYERIRYKDVLSKETKQELETVYLNTEYWAGMIDDLASIGIDKAAYSSFFDLLYGFHKKHLYGTFNLRCYVEEDEQYVTVDVLVNTSLKEAVSLTSRFERTLVDYAVETGRDDILSKFLVYYKSADIEQDESHPCIDTCLEENEDVVLQMPVTIEDIYTQKYEIEQNKFTPKEAYNRLLISRGYYASFLYARELFNGGPKYKLTLYSECLDNKGYGSHEKIYESLIRSEATNLKYVGKILKKYHKLRKISDYKMYLHIKDYDAISAEQHFQDCKERIDFFIKNGNVDFPC